MVSFGHVCVILFGHAYNILVWLMTVFQNDFYIIFVSIS